ncbi:MAG: fibrobacter succinogenes major paralogous domain-containing protein [Fibromonadales bacterium]|nr:fibrobacter succinogenes major paralogous domain-containing protein [Fibromonadales bacterium]
MQNQLLIDELKPYKLIYKKLSILLVLLIGGIGVQTVFAQTAWKGTVDSAWYTIDKSATSYTIFTAEELAGLAQLVNRGTSFQGKTIVLGANIVLNDTNAQGGWRKWISASENSLWKWTPIGNSTNSFKGTFNGNGKVVCGLYINNNTADYQGLFGVAYEGKIHNLGLVGFFIKGKLNVGGISGRLQKMPTLSCTGLPKNAVAGVPVSKPTVTCSIDQLIDENFLNAPYSWDNPSAGNYVVTVTGTCDGIPNLTASCDTLKICDNCLIDIRDDRIYKTVKIGEQTWMAENLNYNATNSKCYDNNLSNCAKYGRLYDWATAMNINATYNNDKYIANENHQGICPTGWHLPIHSEWKDLTDFAGGAEVAGSKLKATSGWSGSSYNGTDDYGFSALPGGDYEETGFGRAGYYGYWWTSMYQSNPYAYYQYIINLETKVYQNFGYKSNLYSVRCLKN